jgi:hypothetical protein
LADDADRVVEDSEYIHATVVDFDIGVIGMSPPSAPVVQNLRLEEINNE